jgi:hypothetical protein
MHGVGLRGGMEPGRFQNPLHADPAADDDGDEDASSGVWSGGSASAEARHGRLSRHETEKKIMESSRGGTDPYVRLYLGTVPGKTVARTESVVADAANDLGRQPIWTAEQVRAEEGSAVDNVLYTKPSAADEFVTFEVWDSDLDADDLLGGRSIRLPEIVSLLDDTAADSGFATLNLQLFDARAAGNPNAGFLSGHDAGVLRLRISREGASIRFEVQAAIDLLPDTPTIRDLRTFSDWSSTVMMTQALLVYLAVGTAFFAWFFGEYACAGAHKQLCVDGSGVPTDSSAAVGLSTTLQYPGAGGRVLDGLLFMVITSSAVGWGNQPVDFTAAPDEVSVPHFKATQLLLVVTILSGIVFVGLLVGSMGRSFRSFFRSHNAILYERLISSTPLVAAGAHGEKAYFDEQSTVRCGRVPGALLAFIGMLMVNLLGALAFLAMEDDLDFIDALYLTVVSVTTVGYGDLAPSTAPGKAFAVGFIPIGVCFVANCIDHISSAISRKRAVQLEQYVLGQFGDASGAPGETHLSAFDFEELQRSASGRLAVLEQKAMTKNDFRVAMLLRLGRVEASDLESIDSVWTQLDSSGSGTVTQLAVVGEQQDTMVKRIDRLTERWETAAEAAEAADALTDE